LPIYKIHADCLNGFHLNFNLNLDISVVAFDFQYGKLISASISTWIFIFSSWITRHVYILYFLDCDI